MRPTGLFRVSSTCVMFFFQAEDGIRDRTVTGVQTCALPIWTGVPASRHSGSRSVVPEGRGQRTTASMLSPKIIGDSSYILSDDHYWLTENIFRERAESQDSVRAAGISTTSSSAAGSGRRPVQFAQPQKIAVVELTTPDHAPITRGLTRSEATPA